jgi:hypothetical protein
VQAFGTHAIRKKGEREADMATHLESFELDGSISGNNGRADVEADWSGSDDGVDLDSPGDSTCTLIETANSTYLFLPAARGERRGLLVGGAVGESPATAIFVGRTDAAGAAGHQKYLRTGYPAVFDLAVKGGYKRLVTSPVVRLMQIQVGSGEPPPSHH